MAELENNLSGKPVIKADGAADCNLIENLCSQCPLKTSGLCKGMTSDGFTADLKEDISKAELNLIGNTAPCI